MEEMLKDLAELDPATFLARHDFDKTRRFLQDFWAANREGLADQGLLSWPFCPIRSVEEYTGLAHSIVYMTAGELQQQLKTVKDCL